MLTCPKKGTWWQEGFGEVPYGDRDIVQATHRVFAGSIATSQNFAANVPGGAYLEAVITGQYDAYYSLPIYHRKGDFGFELTGGNGTIGTVSGVLLNRIDGNNNYSAIVYNNGSGHVVSLDKTVGGVQTVLLSQTFPIPGGGKWKLRYRRIGNTHYLQYNGANVGAGSVVDNSVLLLDPVDNQPGFELLGLRAYAGTGGTIRFYNFIWWLEEAFTYVVSGVGNTARLVDSTGTVLAGPVAADVNGVSAIDVSGMAYPLNARPEALSGGSIIDTGGLYHEAWKYGVVPGMRWVTDPMVPWKNPRVLGLANLDKGGHGGGKLLNPCVVYNPADQKYHLFCDANDGGIVSAITHYTNPAFDVNGWTLVGDIPGLTGNFGDCHVAFLNGDWVMSVQRYSPNTGIYVYKANDATLHAWTLQATVAPVAAAGQPEGTNLWGSSITYKHGRYIVLYEAERTQEKSGAPSTRRISAAWCSTLNGTWVYGFCIAPHFDRSSQNPRPFKYPSGYSAPAFFDWGGKLYCVMEATLEGAWTAYLFRSVDGLWLDLATPEPISLGFAKNFLAPRDMTFSVTINVKPDGTLLGAFHTGDVGTQADGVALWAADLVLEVTGNGSGRQTFAPFLG